MFRAVSVRDLWKRSLYFEKCSLYFENDCNLKTTFFLLFHVVSAKRHSPVCGVACATKVHNKNVNNQSAFWTSRLHRFALQGTFIVGTKAGKPPLWTGDFLLVDFQNPKLFKIPFCRGWLWFHRVELTAAGLVPLFSALLPHLPSNGQGKPISRTCSHFIFCVVSA